MSTQKNNDGEIYFSFSLEEAEEMATQRYDYIMRRYGDETEALANSQRLKKILMQPVKIPKEIFGAPVEPEYRLS